MKAEDMIGKTWFCPKCNKEIIITKNGIEHICTKFYIRKSIQDLIDIEELMNEMENQLLFSIINKKHENTRKQ